jgi:sialate O-acetylesterase
MFRARVLVAGLVLLCALAGWSVADVKPHGLFTDHMVLQQGVTLNVWGTADEGEQVTVQFRDQEKQATAKNGKWKIVLDKQSAGGPFDLTIRGKNTITLKDVLVGDVWIASGQSNMQWSVNASENPKEVAAASKNEQLRLFTVPRNAADEPQDHVQGQWAVCGPDTVGNFSAVAYHFGRYLQRKKGVPVGLISSNFGGTPAEAWTSKEALAASETLKHYLGAPRNPNNKSRPYGLYNAMIHPLLPFGIRGAIWYQGESNAGKAFEYRELFPTMIADWRHRFGQGDFPFLFVQLAPFMKIVDQPAESQWAELRDAQLQTALNVKNTAMVVITDLGDEKDIHPKPKGPVGERLAIAALALAYGENIVYSGPIYKSQKVQGGKIVLSFDHVGQGLVVKGDELKGFTICGADGKFVHAYAKIVGDNVEVQHPEVPQPVAVRFGWANYPVVNLWNKDGLPASPFRTDNFRLTTQPQQ